MDLVVDISLEIEGYSSLINEEEMKKYIKEGVENVKEEF